MSMPNELPDLFVEAIVAGKPPLVTGGTWMAHELLRYDLGKLIMDFDGPDVFLQMHRWLADPTVRHKLARMQQAYAQYHSQENFTAVFRRIYADAQAGGAS